MPRGNKWELHYDPDASPNSLVGYLDDLKNSTGHQDYVIKSRENNASRDLHIRAKTFVNCDFKLENISFSSFTNVRFEGCSFTGTWQDVKFSGCTFLRCHLAPVKFIHCAFMPDCLFTSFSTSAELFTISGTTISATPFLKGCLPNTRGLDDAKANYQLYRHHGTKAKIAQAVLLSTKDEPDLDLYFEAYREAAKLNLAWKIKEALHVETREGDKVNVSVRTGLSSLHALPARVEYWSVVGSGWLTDWGRQVFRALAFFLIVNCVFTVIYLFDPSLPVPGSVIAAILRSLEISLVAGYDTHRKAESISFWEFLKFLNVIVGLYWYSLLLPTITRRLLR